MYIYMKNNNCGINVIGETVLPTKTLQGEVVDYTKIITLIAKLQ